MVKKSEINKKGRLAKSTLSVVLAASMVLTSSSFVWAAPVEDIAIVEEGDAVVEAVEAPVEEAVGINADAPEIIESTVGDEAVGVATAEESKVKITDIADIDYNGQKQMPAIEIKYDADGDDNWEDEGTVTLLKGTDYTVEYYNSTNAGDADSSDPEKGPYAEITFIGETYGNLDPQKKAFTIKKLDLAKAAVSYSNVTGFVYNGTAQYPAITDVTIPVVVNGQATSMKVDKDQYDVISAGAEGTDLIQANESKSVKLKAKTDGNFSSETSEKAYSIDKKVLQHGDVTVSLPTVIYSSSNTAASIANTVVATDTLLDPDATLGNDEYSVEFNVDGAWVASTSADGTKVGSVGTHSFRIKTTSDCVNYVADAYVEGTYEVAPIESFQMFVDKTDITPTGYTKQDGVYTAAYNGKDQFPNITEIGSLKSDVEFKVITAKSEWKNSGEYTLELHGLGNYNNQSATVPFKIERKKLNTNDTTEDTDGGISVSIKQGTTHSGQPSAISVVIKDTNRADGEQVLVKDTDYSYTTEKVGNDTFVIITGLGNYTTDVSSTVKTLKVKVPDKTATLDLNDSSISATVKTAYTYDGKAKKPAAVTDIEVIEKDTTPYTLTAKDYYVSSYKGNDVAGEATVEITGKGRYTGTREIKFKIAGLSFADTFEIDPASVKDIEYTGNDVKTTVKNNLRVQFTSTKAKYTQYDIEYYSNGVEVKGDVKDIGTYTLKVVPKAGQYEGSLETTFKVIGKDIAKVATVSEIKDQEFTGKAIEPEMKVTLDGGKALVKDTDYTVTYDKNTEVGTAYVTITGIGTYSGEIVKSFKIIGTDISKATVAVDGTYTYTGKEVIPTVTVKLDDVVIDAANYDVKATDNVNAGTAKVAVTGKGGFTGTTEEVTFEIGKADQKLAVSKATVDALKVRNTNANTYTLKVTGAGTALSYASSNTKVASVSSTGKLSFKHVCGKATITVTAAADDNHNPATLDIAVAVKPATPKITVTARAKGFNAKATTVKDITGYQVGYSTDKSFAASKTKKKLVKTTKALNKNFSGLSAKKGYYVRVRAYKKVGSTVYWGNWTSAKRITTK